MPDQALESVMKYLAVSGREGQYYVEALELMNRAQIAVSCRGWDTEGYFKTAMIHCHIVENMSSIRRFT
ncbi:MAG: hypothetical protein OXR72_20620 [Gemmatimonadota bacterium]|nr:hypothetical protein [Gemmatimonadota bacterium]